MGNLLLGRERSRDAWGWRSLDDFVQDLRFSLRTLRRDRLFAIVAIAMMACAIALNVAVFTVMDAMLFRGYPLVHRNERLLYLQERFPSGRCCIAYPDFEAWRTQARTFEGMAFVSERPITIRDAQARPVDTLAFTVTANTFGLLGVPPLLGRDFVAADQVPGANPVAILNYRFWQNRFDGRADVIGETVYIDRAPATIIGVMPEHFDFPTRENLWMPLVLVPELRERRVIQFMAVGRLRDGATRQQARTELETINRRLEASYPETNRGVFPELHSYSEAISGPDARVVWGSLWVGSWFVLWVACGNLANLLLVRTAGRWREFATRIALGAGQARMVRQILLEMLVLAACAGGLAWWLVEWGVRTWADMTASIFQVLDYRVDFSTCAYLLMVSAVTALLASVPATIRVLQVGESGGLRGDARGITQGRHAKRLAGGLIASQMALAIVLLVGSGVLVRSLIKIVEADTGVRDAGHVLVTAIRLPSGEYSTLPARLNYFERLRTEVRSLPGVEAEALGSTVPARGVNVRDIDIEGRPASLTGDAVQFLTVSAGYFHVMGVPALTGRDFNDGDRVGTLPVVIVNRSFAERFWLGEQAIGKHLRVVAQAGPVIWLTVVGVAPNIMQGDATRQQFRPLVYIPFRQQPSTRAFLFVRTAVAPGAVAQGVRAEAQALEANAIVGDPTTLQKTFAFDRDSMDPEHSELGKHAVVALVFAVIALLLAAVGLYSVIAHSVAQRTREIGVRMAIGASSGDVRRLILRDGMAPVAIGIVLGLAASVIANRILQSQLVGVSPYDVSMMTLAPSALTIVALLACYVPARRAMSVDPAVALLHE
jgi:putative ABC transport system permease protein